MKSRVLAVAVVLALGGGAVMTTPAFAQSDEAVEIAQLKQQLAVLQAKVNELERRSHAQPSGLHAQSGDISHQQNLEVTQQQAKPAQAAPDAWASSTKIGGTAFIDFTDLDQTKNGAKTDASGTGLDVKRFYLTVDHAFNDVWTANLTTDFRYNSNGSERRRG